MSEVLAGIIESMNEVVGRLNPTAVRADDATRMWEQLATIERLANAGRVLLAGRGGQSAAWRQAGHRTAASWMAATAGESVGTAEAALTTSSQLNDLPDTAAALRAGELSA